MRIYFAGFPIRRPFSKIENISDLHSDDKEGKILKNMDKKYFSNQASFFGKPCIYLSFTKKQIKYH